jgi:hypothetical protein
MKARRGGVFRSRFEPGMKCGLRCVSRGEGEDGEPLKWRPVWRGGWQEW